jgi:hypothetical protein
MVSPDEMNMSIRYIGVREHKFYVVSRQGTEDHEASLQD